MTSSIYSEEEFWPVFKIDLQRARGRVIIQSPFVTPRRLKLLMKDIHALSVQGVIFCFHIQRPYLLEPDVAVTDYDKMQEQIRDEQFQHSLRILKMLDIHVNIRPDIHQKFAVVDGDVLYEGSLNILSYNNTEEHMRRFDDVDETERIIRKYRLRDCTECAAQVAASAFDCENRSNNLSSVLRSHRERLGLSQRELARRSNLAQAQISGFEQGSNMTLSSLSLIMNEMGLEAMVVPRNYAPVMARLLNKLTGSSISGRSN